MQAKGAMLQLDNWLAKPEYTARPLPYEWAIARQFVSKPALRLMPLRMRLAVLVDHRPTSRSPSAPSWMIPAAVVKGQKWSALLTRETGSMDPVLTSYIQTLIASMYTERGRFTLMLDTHRQPVIYHQDDVVAPDARTVEVNAAAPGVTFDLVEDWEQSPDRRLRAGHLLGRGHLLRHAGQRGRVDDVLPAGGQPAPDLPDHRASNGWFDRDVDAQGGHAAGPAGPRGRRRRRSWPAPTWPASPTRG